MCEMGQYYDLPYAARLCLICSSGDTESEEHFMSKCSKYKSLRDELHIRVNNRLKNVVPEQCVIEEHILKSDNPYVQKALAKYIFDAFNLQENQMGNKNIPKNNRGNEVTSHRECVADYTLFSCNLLNNYLLTYLTVIYQFSGTTFQCHHFPFVNVNVNIPLVSHPSCQLICISTMLT